MNNQNYNGYNNQQPYNQGQSPYTQQPQYNQYQPMNNYTQQPQMQQPQQNRNQAGYFAEMIQAIKLFFSHYKDFKSTSNRPHWWFMKLWELCYLIIGVLLLKITGTNNIISALTIGQMGGAKTIIFLFKAGIMGILMVLIDLCICVPLLALRTRRFNDAGIPFPISAGINIARVVLFWLAIMSKIMGIIFLVLMAASFVIELLPSKINGSNTQNNQMQQPMNNTPQYTSYNQPNMNPDQYQQMPQNTYNQQPMQQPQASQQPPMQQQPMPNQQYQQPQQPQSPQPQQWQQQ